MVNGYNPSSTPRKLEMVKTQIPNCSVLLVKQVPKIPRESVIGFSLCYQNVFQHLRVTPFKPMPRSPSYYHLHLAQKHLGLLALGRLQGSFPDRLPAALDQVVQCWGGHTILAWWLLSTQGAGESARVGWTGDLPLSAISALSGGQSHPTALRGP